MRDETGEIPVPGDSFAGMLDGDGGKLIRADPVVVQIEEENNRAQEINAPTLRLSVDGSTTPLPTSATASSSNPPPSALSSRKRKRAGGRDPKARRPPLLP